jgi:dTDP-4-amino-4,6-dideoxy-D-glucose transaminase
MAEHSKLSGREPVFAKPMQIVRPTFPPVDAILENFSKALATGQVTNNGPWVQEFERRLTQYLGVPTLVFSSGQAALMAMVRSAGVEGGEVIVASFSFPATPHAVVWGGGTPVFADIRDDLSFTIDVADVERRITSSTVAILSVDPYGIACDYEALSELGRCHKLKVLIDSAASFGTAVGGRRVGGMADAQIFSFHATKAFNTMEGGCLCSHDGELMERARILRNFGQGAGADCSSAGFNGKMMEVCALIGIEQLKAFDEAICVRRRSANRIAEGLSGIEGVRVGCAPDGQEPIWLYLPTTIDAGRLGTDRDGLADRLARENLMARKYYSPACHELSVYRAARRQPSLPVSERAGREVLALPIYNNMTDDECDGVIEAFRRATGDGVKNP